MKRREWRDHVLVTSQVGKPEEERPIFIGPAPTAEARREYMGAYLPWAIGIGTREWLEEERPEAERITAKAWADEGYESMGHDLWEFLVDSTLWNIACE
jgi:hypothetical protein